MQRDRHRVLFELAHRMQLMHYAGGLTQWHLSLSRPGATCAQWRRVRVNQLKCSLIMLFAHISQTCFSCLNDKITFAHSVCCHVYTGAYSRRIGLCQIDYCPLFLQLLSLWVGSVYQWCKCCLHCAISLRCYLRLPFLFIKWSLVFLLFFIFPSIIFLSCKSGCVLSMFDDV